MVKGIDIFQEYFNEYTDQYVLIGGAACSVSFEEQDINFGRTTKDLDIVLIVEAQTKEFGNGLPPIHIDDSVSSLSAILLNDAYYQALMDGRENMRGISVLKPEWIIPFKAKAWRDLREKKDVDSSDIKKHRNDIIRIVSDMVLQKCILPDEVRKDMEKFIEQFDVTESELKNLKIRGTKPEDIKRVLQTTYLD